jgi:hypothetical protein
MTPLRSTFLGFVASALIVSGATAAGSAPAAPSPAAALDLAATSLVGRYDGHQMEIAALLELRADGRFQYGLAYGALDEEAQGRWEFDGSRVLLTSDPVVPPAFVMLTAKPLPAGQLKLSLDVPQGMDRQYFNARVLLADGRSIERQLSEEGLDLPLGPGDQAVSIAMMLPVYGLEGEASPLPKARGAEVHFRFDPNDLGKVAFAREPLLVQPDSLLLQRYDRTIVFKRTAAP